MSTYHLATDGDDFEKHYWDEFIKDRFPSYEAFWQKSVAPLTNRPKDIHFKTNPELASISKGPQDICIAQLHYTALRHLARAYEMFNLPRCNLDILTEGMARITGALDVAFELLERYKNPTSYDPWLEKRDASTGRLGGNEARRQWQDANGYPLQHLRNYRNHLIHGRLTPGLIGTDFYVPKIGTESKYFDWRLITDQNNNPGLNTNDLSPACGVLRGAWDETLDYLESSWRSNLL